MIQRTGWTRASAIGLLGVVAFAPGLQAQTMSSAPNTAPLTAPTTPNGAMTNRAAPGTPNQMTPVTPGQPSGGQPSAGQPSAGQPMTGAPNGMAQRGPAERIDPRIADLHRRLQITPAQEGAFNAFAEVMRTNAQAMDGLLQQRGQVQHMNAVDDLRSYGDLTQAHADSLKRLLPVFQTLYDSLSDQQKRTADTLFGQVERREQQRATNRAG